MTKKVILLLTLLISGLVLKAAQYNILDFGANSGGKTLTTKQIQNAINKCHADGGGVVFVPKGDYLVGTINLKSNVEFRFETGARLIATTDLKQYQKHNENLAGVFYTEDAHNVSITGNGIVFGQGMEYMQANNPKKVVGKITDYTRQKDNYRKIPTGVVADGPLHPKDRFAQMIIFSNCTSVTLQDFKCIDAPYWTFLVVHCDRVKVQGVDINNNLLIPNSDGLDVISSSNVTISDCIFTCGDDALVLAGYDQHFGDPGFKGILKPSTNINVSNCILQSRSSGIRIGGWDKNPMINYNFSNITIFDSNVGINMTVRDTGGIENMTFSNIRIETRLHTGDWWGNGEPIKISAMPGGPNTPPIAGIRNVFFNNITTNSEGPIIMYASEHAKLENIYFNNFEFILKESKLVDITGGNFDLRPTTVEGMELYESNIPVIYVENAENVYFNQGNIGWKGSFKPYHTNAIEAKNVHNLKLNNMTATASPSNANLPALSTVDCTRVQNNIDK